MCVLACITPVPSANLHKLSKRCVHLSLHLLVLHALMPFIALLYHLMFCCGAGVYAGVHAVGIIFAAAFLQLLTQPLLPLVLALLHALLLFWVIANTCAVALHMLLHLLMS